MASLILRIQRGRRGLLQIQTTPRRSCKTPCKCDNIFASVARGRLQEGMHSSPEAGGGSPRKQAFGEIRAFLERGGQAEEAGAQAES